MNLKNTSFSQFLVLAPTLDCTVLEKLKTAPKPVKIGRHTLPDNLNDLMLGKLFQLQSMEEPLIESAKIIFGCDEKYLMSCSAMEVISFNVWVGSEMLRIAQMFSSIKIDVSPEETRAGVDKLNFGMFGVVDNYARRMGIIDHDYVLECVPWLRVWQCLKNDAENAMYERRLRKVYANSNKQ